MTDNPRLKYILVARSGCGKTTMAAILEQELGLRRCITSTTRPMREGEVDGRDYHFRAQLDPETLFESAQFGAYRYGTTWAELNNSDFVILDPQGVAHYREHFPGKLTVIQLERSGIAVDAARMARDAAAGFDTVQPDIIVRGETVEEMSRNLLQAIRAQQGRAQSALDDRISAAEAKRAPSPAAPGRRSDRHL